MKTNNWLICPILALFTPFFLWPIELLLPYPFIIEELAKTALVLFAWPNTNTKQRLQMAVVIGVCFALTESVLYFFNLTELDQANSLLIRLILTTSMHTTTTLLIALSSLKSKKYLPFGVLFASLVHFLYNSSFS